MDVLKKTILAGLRKHLSAFEIIDVDTSSESWENNFRLYKKNSIIALTVVCESVDDWHISSLFVGYNTFFTQLLNCVDIKGNVYYNTLGDDGAGSIWGSSAVFIGKCALSFNFMNDDLNSTLKIKLPLRKYYTNLTKYKGRVSVFCAGHIQALVQQMNELSAKYGDDVEPIPPQKFKPLNEFGGGKTYVVIPTASNKGSYIVGAEVTDIIALEGTELRPIQTPYAEGHFVVKLSLFNSKVQWVATDGTQWIPLRKVTKSKFLVDKICERVHCLTELDRLLISEAIRRFIDKSGVS